MPHLIEIGRMASTDPPWECAWQALRDPLVQEVVAAYPYFESGQLGFALGADPPAVLVDAMTVYHRARQAIMSKDADRRAAKRENAASKRGRRV